MGIGPCRRSRLSGQRVCSLPLRGTDSKLEAASLVVAIVRMCVVEVGSLVDQAVNEITEDSQLQNGEPRWR